MKKILWILVAVALVGWILYSNIQQQKEQSNGKRNVYAVLPLTGQLANYGKDIQKTIEWYIQEYDVPFKIKYLDSEGNPARAITTFQQESLNDNQPLVISAMSFISSPLAQVVEQKKGFLFAITTTTIATDTHSFFRVTRDSHEQVRPIVPFVIKNYKKVSIVYTQEDHGLEEFNFIKENLSKAGVEIVSSLPLTITQTDVRNDILKLKSKPSEAIIILGTPSIGYMNIFYELYAQGYSGQIISDSGLISPYVFNSVKKHTEGSMVAAMRAEIDMEQSPKITKIKEELKKNNIPTYIVTLETIDALDLISHLLSKNLSFSQKTFLEIGNWEGVTANMQFTNHGSAYAKSYIMAQIKDGKVVPLESETK